MTKIDGQPASDERLERRSREVFDAGVAGHDARSRSRLNQARQAALDAARGHAASPMHRRMNWPRNWLVPVSAAAALGLIALTAVQFMRANDAAPIVDEARVVTGTVDDLEIIASSEELEMLKNMEFYAWLETQPDGLDADNAGEAG